MIHFISFGQKGYYENLSYDLLKRIKKAYPTSNYKVYNETFLPLDYVRYAVDYPRGFGYWRWKPFIIMDTLKSAQSNDIIIYIDGRTHFKSRRISWLDQFYNDITSDFCVWQTNFRENNYTTSQIFELFHIVIDSYIANSGQIATTFFAFRKNTKTIILMEQYMSLLRDKYELFDDSHNSNQKNGFIESRHEQSAFSLLIKMFNGNIYFIPDNFVNKRNSLYTHFKTHNERHANFRNHLRIILLKFSLLELSRRLRRIFHIK